MAKKGEENMTIEERLENMERELGRVKQRNRWLLGAIVLVAGGLIVPLVFETTAFRARAQGAKTAKEIRANKFVLEDENGKDRAWLLMGSEGSPMLLMYDENGETRVGLTVEKDGPRLRLWDENGNVRAGMGVGKVGPALALYDEKGQARAALTTGKDNPTLELYDGKGQVRASLDVSKEGPGLELYDENGKDRASLDVSKEGPWLVLHDENEKMRFAAGKTRTISPDGKTTEYPESSLILFGPDGKIIWSAIK